MAEEKANPIIRLLGGKNSSNELVSHDEVSLLILACPNYETNSKNDYLICLVQNWVFEAAFNNVQAELNKVDEKKLGIWVNMSRKTNTMRMKIENPLLPYWSRNYEIEEQKTLWTKNSMDMNVNFTHAFERTSDSCWKSKRISVKTIMESFRWRCKDDAKISVIFRKQTLWWDMADTT